MRANYFQTPPTVSRTELGFGLGYRFEWQNVLWNFRLNIDNLIDDTYDSNVIIYHETDPFTGAHFEEKRRWERYYPPRTWRLALRASF